MSRLFDTKKRKSIASFRPTLRGLTPTKASHICQSLINRPSTLELMRGTLGHTGCIRGGHLEDELLSCHSWQLGAKD